MYERIEKIKNHVSEHRVVYIVSGVSFALGGVSVVVLGKNTDNYPQRSSIRVIN